MFDFLGLNMFGTYDQRKVDRNNYDWGFISTAEVTDGNQPYETAVSHKRYGSNIIVVESYDTKEQAKIGHEKWVKIMTAEKLPDTLTECYNSTISNLYKESVKEPLEAKLI